MLLSDDAAQQLEQQIAQKQNQPVKRHEQGLKRKGTQAVYEEGLPTKTEEPVNVQPEYFSADAKHVLRRGCR